MRAGNLDQRVTFRSRTITSGRANVPVEHWEDAFTCWAEVRDVSATERTAAPKLMPARTATFFVRWRSGVVETMQVRWDERDWNITGIKRIGRREGLEIAAEAIEV